MKKPNLFIAGATKCGTTTLVKFLSDNDSVFMPSDELTRDQSFFSWRRSSYSLEDYLSVYSSATDKQVFLGDGSATYLHDESISALIYEFNPEAKVIIMLRNPIDRGYSLYRWMVQEGYEWAGSYEKALELESKRAITGAQRFFAPHLTESYMYFSTGLYYSQVKAYKELFKDNLMVVNLDNFYNDFDSTYSSICSFLGIEVNNVNKEVLNKSKDVFSPKLQFFLRKISNIIFMARSVLGIAAKNKDSRDFLMTLGLYEGKKNKLPEKIREQLKVEYLPDLKKLSDLLGEDFTYWCK